MKTYGTVQLVNTNGRREWHIEASPSVMMRLRRLFTGSDRRGKVIKVSDTLEVARDIRDMLLTRYPMTVREREYLEQRAATHCEAQDAVNRILAAGYTPRAFELALPAREYQRVAAEMALRSRALLVADDLGLGKTVSAIAALSDPSARPALVVTMTHLPGQWEAELAKFLPAARVHRIRDGKVYDIASWGKRGRAKPRPASEPALFGHVEIGHRLPDVIVTSYSKLRTWADVLAPIVRSVVFDEVQELRKRSSQKWGAARQIAERTETRIGLSATPIYNYGGEMYSIFEVLSPGALGTWKEFAGEWCGEDASEEKAKIKDPVAFGLWAREQGLMLRRKRADVGRELPAIQRVIHHVDTDEKPLEAIEGRAAELARKLLELGGAGIDKMKAGAELDWRLRQATGLAKAAFAAEFIDLLVESGEKVLAFAWHIDVHAIIAEKLRASGKRVALYTGSESPAAKEEAKRSFLRADGAHVLLMSLRSGAGLDGLQSVCRTVVHAELDWSPQVHAQGDGRIHRDGQTDPVVAYYLVSDSGSDPIVSDVLGIKRQQAEGVVNPDAPLAEVAQVDPDHVKKLAAAFLEKAQPTARSA